MPFRPLPRGSVLRSLSRPSPAGAGRSFGGGSIKCASTSATRSTSRSGSRHLAPSSIPAPLQRGILVREDNTRRFAVEQFRNYASTAPAAMYTASFAFFEALWDAGVTHCFVNLGSDHPSIIEAMVKGQREKKGRFPRMITCPNEMVAMSMADGYARLTGKPQCVIVHVDVGTQGLGAAVHNSSTGRAPVFVFAGLSPFTLEGELRGSRTEYIHWIQDVPDQKQILAQYCRYSGEVKTGTNVKQMVNRALQFSKSDPQGPVYLCGAREVMEAEIVPYSIPQEEWDPVELGGLPSKAVDKIAEALAGAKEPLIITGYGGRDHKFPGALVELANAVKGLRVLDTGGSDMCFPADHPAWLGLRFGSDEAITTADVILVLNCDVPWVNTLCHPRKDARVFHVDVDPLKQQMPVFYIKAESRYRADSLAAVGQITDQLKSDKLASLLNTKEAEARGMQLQESYERRLATIQAKTKPSEDGEFGTGHLCRELRRLCPDDTIWAIEAVTNTGFVHDNIQPVHPGSWINCGGGGLGWSGGGALGIKLASDAENGGKGKFVVQVQQHEPYIIIGENSQPLNLQHGAITRKFYSKKPPPISIEDYLARLHRFCPMSTAVYLATSLYIHRLAVDERAIPVTRRNCHRLVLAGLRVAMKALEDLSYAHGKMAKVGGVSEVELARLEISFCFLANFELVVREDALQKHADVLREGTSFHVLRQGVPTLTLNRRPKERILTAEGKENEAK
ncbi:hypothetical protein BN1723_013702 [Verticillium longisporum]|uniref:Pyruvate decarboxylase n=1 Tax=Verticillium longisporum TaxID=100787 RepID=A0A0G4LW61_VERLO|nr:hypothetical protein BN1723_013702 [Verticillium longisporum]